MGNYINCQTCMFCDRVSSFGRECKISGQLFLFDQHQCTLTDAEGRSYLGRENEFYEEYEGYEDYCNKRLSGLRGYRSYYGLIDDAIATYAHPVQGTSSTISYTTTNYTTMLRGRR